MSIRIAVLAAGLALAVATPGVALAQANVMKECGAEYQTAKAANTLGGKSWKDFLGECRTRRAAATAPASSNAAPPAAASTPPASGTAAAPATTAPGAAPAPKPASGGQQAMRSRQKACGAEWQAQKVELRKADPNLKWPQYWSACNKRLKAAGR